MKKLTLTMIACLVLLPGLALGKAPACDQIAEQVDYIQSIAVGDQRILDVGIFRVQIPLKNVSQLGLTSEGHLQVFYAKGEVLTLRTHLVVDEFLHWTARKPTKGKITTADWADITFTKTACDKGPLEPVDAKRWKRAIYEKGLYFDNATEVIKTQSGELTYYLSNDSHQGYTGHAFITHSTYKTTTLIMTSVGIPYKEFKRIVLNITQRKP
ncbi:hypothetical protein MNBD_GAMMA21-1505 [hydrothermal vent metagenome]|uniref:Uncharacterized protein n=1 Tax=hydrothermal vent metagenome TaxID=652676 RepID=A0A3B1A781_9ZZZZ